MSELRRAAGRRNAHLGHHGADAPETLAAELAYREVAAEQYIRRLVAAAPPLSAAQRTRLAALLAPTDQSGGRAA